MTIAIISIIREPWGGSEELWAQMALEALRQNHKVIHLSYNTKTIHPKVQMLIHEGMIECHRPGFFPKNINPIKKKIIIAINYVKKQIKPPFKKIFSYHPDMVLYNGTCLSIVREKDLLQCLKKHDTTLHILGHYFSDLEKNLSPSEMDDIIQLYQYAKRKFFVSLKSLEQTQNFLSIKLEDSFVVRNPVNISSIEKLPYPNNRTTQFAAVGILVCAHKGQDILLDVLADEKWRQRNWHLNIYGEGEDENYLKTLSQKNQLANKISFHGKVNDIRAVWEHNNILLMPSRMEGMPLAVVEAMLCGRAVVATDVGGIPEWVRKNKDGFIAPSATIEAFDTAMERAWEQKDNWQQLGSNAHHRAIELYDPQAGKSLLNLISA